MPASMAAISLTVLAQRRAGPWTYSAAYRCRSKWSHSFDLNIGERKTRDRR